MAGRLSGRGRSHPDTEFVIPAVRHFERADPPVPPFGERVPVRGVVEVVEDVRDGEFVVEILGDPPGVGQVTGLPGDDVTRLLVPVVPFQCRLQSRVVHAPLSAFEILQGGCCAPVSVTDAADVSDLSDGDQYRV